MKKEINKIIMTIGFATACIGLLLQVITVISDENALDLLTTLNMFSLVNIALIICYPFVYSKNNVVKNCGYGLAFLLGVSNLIYFNAEDIGYTIVAVGALIMAIASIVYYIVLVCKFFSIGKCKELNDTPSENAFETISTYNELFKEGIVTKEEFDKMKESLFGANKQPTSIEDLKKWKKLLDQKIITDAEFAKIKADILKK